MTPEKMQNQRALWGSPLAAKSWKAAWRKHISEKCWVKCLPELLNLATQIVHLQRRPLSVFQAPAKRMFQTLAPNHVIGQIIIFHQPE